MEKEFVSIEKVLNSRCSSSLDSELKKSHWGSFTNISPEKKVIDQVLKCSKIPRFSSNVLLHWFTDNHLFLGFEKLTKDYDELITHIESGMQQEAVYLACASLGLGCCIHNQGVNGTEYGKKIATASHVILEMEDSYVSGKFSTKAPGPKKHFKVGKNLSEPCRDSDVEFLPNIGNLATVNESGPKATRKDISQLLWAAKGRTPHYIRKHVWKFQWGLTIPTWSGVQDFTSIYLVREGKLFRYKNWTKMFSPINRLFRQHLKFTRGNPTHDLDFVKNVKIGSVLDGHDTAIILCRNEETNRALWEVGYMFENMFLQCKSLGISYDSKVFMIDELSNLINLGLSNTVAAILL